MKENNKLLKIGIIASLFTILTLLYLSNIIEPKLQNIEDITEEQLNQKTKIIAQIQTIQDHEGFQIITVEDSTGEIDVLTNSKEPIKKTENDILIIGRITEYEDELQITADKIIEIED